MKICEYFTSISREGITSGEPSIFLRLSGCSLSCPYCDTKYHVNGYERDIFEFTNEFVEYCLDKRGKFGIKNIIITGGEPLLQREELNVLLNILDPWFEIRIETNGSIEIESRKYNCRYSMDYKLPSAFNHYLDFMDYSRVAMKNIEEWLYHPDDEIKLVVNPSNHLDFVEIDNLFESEFECTNIIVQPVYGYSLNDIIEKMKDKSYYGKLKFCIQMHKELKWR